MEWTACYRRLSVTLGSDFLPPSGWTALGSCANEFLICQPYMIASFFQSLESENVAYLLISGQATVLYGAATFSEDIDIWIRPTQANANAVLAALRAREARYYKLTPPPNEANLRRGHGFHFVIPDDPEIYLDVMGCPPRVGDYDAAMSSAQVIDTSWGRIPTVGLKDLVAMKSTQRLGDYPIIGQLVLRYLEEQPDPTPADLQWAINNVYTIEDLDALLSSFPDLPWRSDYEVLQAYVANRRSDYPPPDLADAVEASLFVRLNQARKDDRAYWVDIIDELRDFRASEELMPAGQPV